MDASGRKGKVAIIPVTENNGSDWFLAVQELGAAGLIDTAELRVYLDRKDTLDAIRILKRNGIGVDYRTPG